MIIDKLKEGASAFSTGVVILSVKAEDSIRAITVNSFVSLSFSPPLVMVSVSNSSIILKDLKIKTLLGLSILSSSQKELSDCFSKKTKKNEAFEFHQNIPLIKDCLAWYTVEIVNFHEAGDHKIVIMEVKSLNRDFERKPLVYFSGSYIS